MTRTVSDVMTRNVVAVRPSTPLKEIVRRLDAQGLSAVPVVDDEGRLAGIVTDADVLRVGNAPPEIARSRANGGPHAADIMSAPVVSLRPGATLREAMGLMCDRDVGRLPVVDDEGRVVGILSRGDLLRAFLRPDDEIRDEVLARVVERVLGIHGAGVRVEVRDGVLRLTGSVERRSLIVVLVGLAHAVEGVAAVEIALDYEVDDLDLWPGAEAMLGAEDWTHTAGADLPRPT